MNVLKENLVQTTKLRKLHHKTLNWHLDMRKIASWQPKYYFSCFISPKIFPASNCWHKRSIYFNLRTGYLHIIKIQTICKHNDREFRITEIHMQTFYYIRWNYFWLSTQPTLNVTENLFVVRRLVEIKHWVQSCIAIRTCCLP